MPRDHCLCECELPGPFRTGEPGTLAAMESGRVAPGAVVERCDQCRRYPTDASALARLCALGLTDSAAAAGPTFTVHCYAVVRVKFAGVVADDARSAAEQVCDRFDWEAHRDQAEDADEILDLLVDVDGDAEFRRSRRFSADLVEFGAQPVGAPCVAQRSLAPRICTPLRVLQLLLARLLALWRNRFESHDPPAPRPPTADRSRTPPAADDRLR